ncbi:unnamed protein product [Closterium sp. NIES-64]|nr:unnamed protein product [Closterium sp. NIES-64]
MEFHEQRRKKYEEEQLKLQRQKVELLRNNDMEGYLKLVKNMKSERVQNLLKETEAHLQRIAGRIASVRQQKGVVKGQDEGAEPDAGELVIALLCYLVEVKKIPGPFLIVAPASVLPNWVAEFARWAPSLRVSRYSGMPDKRAAIFSREINPWTRRPHNTGNDGGEAQRKWLEERGVANVVVTTYEMLMGKLDRPRLIRLSWEYVVLDEGHRIKSAECKLNAHLKSYKSNHRILLSGTPIQNNLEELWSLLNFLLPSVFNCASDFASWFSQPLSHVLPKKAGSSARGGSADSVQEDVLGEEERLLLINRLHQVLRPFVLRRLKHKVASELPKRLERRIPCAASAYQQWLIQQVLQHQDLSAGTTNTPNFSLPMTRKRSTPSIMNAVMEQRGICNHPFLSTLHDREVQENLPNGPLPPLLSTCGKLETLHRILHKLHAAKHKVLLFCTMTRLLDIVEEYIEGQQKMHAEAQEKKKLLLEEEKKKQQHQLAKGKQQKGKAEEGKGSSVLRQVTRRQQQAEAEQLTNQTPEVHASCSSSTPSASGSNPWNYFRLDGSTGGNEREELVREFNKPDSDVFIFLLSEEEKSIFAAADRERELQEKATPPPVRQPPPGTTVSSTNITAQLSFNASATTTTNSPNPVAVTTPTPGGVTAISPNTTGGPAATGAGPHGSLFPPVFPNPVTTAGGALLGAVGGPTTGALAGAAAGAAAASGEGNATGAGGAGQGAGVTGSGTTMVAVPSPAVLQQPPPLILPPAQQQQLTPPLPPAQQGAGTAGGGFPGFSAAPAGNFAAGAVLGSALGAAAGTAAAAAGSAVASAAQSAAPTPPQIPPPQQQQVQSPAPSAAAVTPGGIVNETLNAVGELSGQGRVVMNGNEMQMQLRAGRGLQVVMGTQQLA